MRIRPLLPILLSTVAMPAVAGDYSVCLSATDSVSCLIEASEFSRQRNAEIDASIERVQRARAREYALSVTHCKTRFSRTPRCLAERAHRFAARQNALIAASIARVEQNRAFEAARRADVAAAAAAAEVERVRRLEITQNALIDASMIAANAERQRRFAAKQNALATASMERVTAERRRQLAQRLAPCTSPDDARDRCIAQRHAAFVAAQNAIVTASIERVKAERDRAFAAARNAESAASIAAVERNRAAQRAAAYASVTSHCARNAASPRCEDERTRELQASLTHCKSVTDTSPRCEAEREHGFRVARNAEIERSMAAVAAARARDVAAIKAQCRTAGYTSPDCNFARQAATETALSTTHCKGATVTPRCEAERARELQASLTHCKSATDTSPRCEAERGHEFRAARNTEVERSIAAVAAARARGELSVPAAGTTASTTTRIGNHTGVSPLETGAIGVPSIPKPSAYEPQYELRRDISADPCAISTTPLQPVLFKAGTQITAEAQPELDRIATAAQSCPGMRIEVHGYSDGGSHFNNRSLSQARAQAVADYLIAAGVGPNRVSAIGRGGRAPVLPYAKGFDPATAGRAEFVIRDPGMDAAARRVMWDLAELLDPTYIPAVANLSP